MKTPEIMSYRCANIGRNGSHVHHFHRGTENTHTFFNKTHTLFNKTFTLFIKTHSLIKHTL